MFFFLVETCRVQQILSSFGSLQPWEEEPDKHPMFEDMRQLSTPEEAQVPQVSAGVTSIPFGTQHETPH